ncbi:TetR/AcrR family transcriptional regulator [Nocardioides sp. WS12]|uniref:TetR/AcrR family transcriptional regulator n=1 Tax=Nocardioides sp. WS12 TaxID=2486272 RepID=UPI0015FAEC63|nr:TetR/AcrR family transcriptional regulator [Nocardioides sp. WS12]
MARASVGNNRADLRRARTRRLLVAAGRELVASKGVAGLRIQDITEQADVALGSFYNHFASKDELVEAVVEESLAEMASTAGINDGNRHQDPAVTAALAVLRIVGIAFSDPELARLLVRLDHSDLVYARALRPQASEVVRAGMEVGRFFIPDVDVVVHTVVAGSLALIRRILDGEHDASVVSLQAELTLRLLGLGVDEAAEIARRCVEIRPDGDQDRMVLP